MLSFLLPKPNEQLYKVTRLDFWSILYGPTDIIFYSSLSAGHAKLPAS